VASTWGRRRGLPGYDEFRTGLTFSDVQSMLWSESEDSADWRYKRRGTVLGLWHSIKQDLYNEAVSRGYLSDEQKK